MSEDPGTTTLLVVDDESAVCRALGRMLRGGIERIITAQTPQDAEAALSATAVTHLICDHYLGPGQPLGADLAAAWRKRYPTIERVIVLTGRDAREICPAPEIDHVLSKTTDAAQLLDLLGLAFPPGK